MHSYMLYFRAAISLLFLNKPKFPGRKMQFGYFFANLKCFFLKFTGKDLHKYGNGQFLQLTLSFDNG